MSRKELKKLKEKLIDLESFQQFITENKITSSQNLKDRFGTVYVWLRKLKLTKGIIYYGQTKTVGQKDKEKEDIKENFNTIEDFQNYIDQNSISSQQDLGYLINQRLLELGFSKYVVYKDRKELPISELFKKYKSFDDFQNFVNQNKIISREDLINRFGNAMYNLLYCLGYSNKLIYYNCNNKLPLTATEEEISYVQNFININKIKTKGELREKIGLDFYNKNIKAKGAEPWVYFYEKEVICLEDFNTLEKVQSYVDKNKIKTMEEFTSRLRFIVQLQGFTKFIKFYKENEEEFTLLTTIDEFNSFVKDNEIKGSADFSKRFPRQYRRATSLNITQNINYFGKIEKEDITTLEQFQEFIDINEIRNPTDFHVRFPTTYQHLSDRRLCNQVNYHGKSIQTNLEFDVENLLNEKGIIIEARKQHSFLTNNKSLDIFIPKYNIAIECQGDQHFVPIDYFGGQEYLNRIKKNDLDKHNECLNNKTALLYYVNPSYVKCCYRKEILGNLALNYIDKVYFGIDELWNKISEIISNRE